MTTPLPSTGDCCADFSRAAAVSRRRFLQATAVAGGAMVTTSVFGDAVRSAAFGAEPGGNVVVVVSLRGGVDGLGLVVPYGDPALAAARPTITVPERALLQKDGRLFGLHPSLAPLEWVWQAGRMAAVHAVGLTTPNRSHFAAMEEIEDADPLSGVRRGWVNRLVGLGGSGLPTEAVHLTSSITPTMLTGPAPTLAAERVDDIAMPGTEDHDAWADRRTRQLTTTWADAPGPLGRAGREALDTVAELAATASTPYQPADGVTYPRDWPATGLSDALRDTARLIRADLGTEVVSIDYGSWDMHSGYGNLEGGRMQSMIGGFAGAMDAFLRDLGPLADRVTVVTISEFGRRVAQNGGGGLDHGWGGVMLLLGGGVVGGYHATWPGLATGQLVEGDLAVTTDYRDVLGEVVQKRLGRLPSDVFPGLVHRPVSVVA